MLKRALIYFENNSDAEYLLRFAKGFSKEFDVEIHGIYIKDLRKYEVVPPMVEGLVVDSANSYVMKEWEALEKQRSIAIKELFIDNFSKNHFFEVEGITSDIILEKMKSYDLLIVAKNEIISSNVKTVLKIHTKPIITVPNLENYKFSSVLFADDKGLRANESFFRFMNLFNNINEITALSINMEKFDDFDMKEYSELRGVNIDFIYKEGNCIKILEEEIDKFDILIMGNLRYNFMLEKLTGKLGVKILETIKLPIFIA